MPSGVGPQPGRDERAGEAQPAGLGEPPLDRTDPAHLAGQADLAERRPCPAAAAARARPTRPRAPARGRRPGRSPGPRRPSRRRPRDWASRMPPRFSSTASTIATRDGVQPGRRPARAGQRRRRDTSAWTSDDQRPPALHGDRHAGAHRRPGAVRQEQPARVGQPGDAGVVEVEAAHLVGRAVAVLRRADQPQPRVPLALELQHDVDQVLEHPRPGDRRRPWSRGRPGRSRCRAASRPG